MKTYVPRSVKRGFIACAKSVVTELFSPHNTVYNSAGIPSKPQLLLFVGLDNYRSTPCTVNGSLSSVCGYINKL